MSKFIIEPSFWKLFPECEIGVILIRGIDNTEDGCKSVRSNIIHYLEKENEEAKKFLVEPVLSQNPVVAVWRQSFAKFKTKKGVHSSIEALLKRIQKGKGVGPINPLVDIYNAVSLQYGLPCGAEDLDAFAGNLRLTVTAGGDEFFALGDEESDNTLPGEVCYLDDRGAVCRCWNWRDGQRTMLTENTRNAFVVFESVDPHRHADLQAAMDTLTGWAEKALGGKISAKKILNRECPEFDFSA